MHSETLTAEEKVSPVTFTNELGCDIREARERWLTRINVDRSTGYGLT